jgi:PAS domain S-box-containing protein
VSLDHAAPIRALLALPMLSLPASLDFTADALIAAAYFSIPITLLWLVRKRRDLPVHAVFVWLGLFSVFAGLTQLLDIWNIHTSPAIALKSATALTAIALAIAAAKVLPEAVALSSPRKALENRLLASDIAERKEAQARLEKANRDVTSILGRITDGFYALDREWRFTYVNPAAERMLRNRSEQLVGRSLWEKFPELVGSDVWQHYHEAVTTQNAVRFERFSTSMNIWVTVHAHPSADGLSVYFQDITPEHALRTSEIRFQAVMDMSPESIFIKDRESRYVFANRRTAELLRKPVAEIVGKTDYDLLPPAVADALRRNDRAVLADGQPIQIEESVETSGGLEAHLVSKFPLRDASGKIYGLCGIATDISARKRAELDKQKFVSLVENSSDFIGFAATDGTVCYLNEAGRALVGLSPEMHVESTRVVDYFPASEQPRIESEMIAIANHEYRWIGEINLRHRLTDEAIPVHLNVFAIRLPGQRDGVSIACVGTDLRYRKEAGAKLQDYAARLEKLSRQLLEAQETERRRIARELHDEIGQSLTLLKLQLRQGGAGGPDHVVTNLGEAEAGVERMLNEVRDLCARLRPALLDDLGLLPALLAKVERWNTQTALHCIFQHDGIAGRRFAPMIETTAYRIVQEALTNVARHAGVNEVRITIWADEEVLQVRIEDSGSGFDLAHALESTGSSGIVGMRERASLAGGELTIVTAHGAGTAVTLELPLGARVTI